MELTAGTTRLVVEESQGARMASLLVQGGASDALHDLQLIGRYRPSAHGWGAFPMAPWAGRVRDAVLRWHGQEHQLPVSESSRPHAIHGLVSTATWDVQESSESAAVLVRDVGDQWPWPARAVLRYDLSASSLTAVLELHALESAMPGWIGIHPWFPRVLDGASAQVSLDSPGLLQRDEAGMPTTSLVPPPAGQLMDPPVNDVFADITWPARVTWPGVVALEVEADHPWAVVFTEREEAVCVEPQTAPPDAANLDLAATVEPGEPMSLTMTWRWTSLAG